MSFEYLERWKEEKKTKRKDNRDEKGAFLFIF